MRRLVLAVSLVLLAPAALAHTEWTDPVPRTPCNGASNLCKTAPCGGVVPGPVVKYFFVGSSYNLAYQETIEHPGHYRIAVSTNGELETAFNGWILADNLVDTTGAAPHDYTWNWTVPDTANCNPCVLQVEQFMMPGTYYSCADVAILPAGSTIPTPTPSGSPTGTATPTPTPGGNPGNDVVHGGCACDVSGGAIPLGGIALMTSIVGAAILARRRSRG